MPTIRCSRFTAFLFATAAVACGGTEPTNPPPTDSPFVAGFEPPALAEGFTRFITPIIRDIPSGQDAMWCQWVSGPLEEDTDILDVNGGQSIGGHHAVLYATMATAPIGTTRPCTNEDQTSIRFIGGVGKEAGSAARLPPGVVYRIPKGSALMANVHYTNYTSGPIDGQSVVDIKLAKADPSRTVASLFANVNVNDVVIAAGQRKAIDVRCTMQSELAFIMFANHLHELGSAASTVIERSGGASEMVVEDVVWDVETVLNPNFRRWDVSAPLMLRAGDVLKTHCEWNNTTNAEVTFPTEMCVGVGFYLGAGAQINCTEGVWDG